MKLYIKNLKERVWGNHVTPITRVTLIFSFFSQILVMRDDEEILMDQGYIG